MRTLKKLFLVLLMNVMTICTFTSNILADSNGLPNVSNEKSIYTYCYRGNDSNRKIVYMYEDPSLQNRNVNEYIDSYDEIKVIQSNSEYKSLQVTYFTYSVVQKTRWIPSGAIKKQENYEFHGVATQRITTYKFPTASMGEYGYIDANDRVVFYEKKGDFIRVLYMVPGGKKLAWIRYTDICTGVTNLRDKDGNVPIL